MNSPPDISVIRSATARLLRQRGDIAAAYLLGSAARGQLRSDSDIDLAMLPMPGRHLSLQDRLALAAELERQVRRTVDVGVVTAGNLVYASEAILNGRRLVTIAAENAAATEARLMGCYLSFRDDRRCVEAAYHAA
jgi:predicted nucleotidyltransferase